MALQEQATAKRVPIYLTPPRTFEAFYQEQRDPIGRALALTLGDDLLGFEAADEAMTKAYLRWTDVRNYRNPEGWVYRCGLNWARSWLRRRKRSRPKDELVAQQDRQDDQHHDVDLERAIRQLSDDHRAVVVLRFYQDWTVEQTAEALNIAPGTVKSRLSRALDLLQTDLASHAPSPDWISTHDLTEEQHAERQRSRSEAGQAP